MTHLSDSHLDDPRSNRELRSEEAARELRDAAVLKRKREILNSTSDIDYLFSEYPTTIASFVRPMMGENYMDYVPEFRACMQRLAEIVADQDTMSIDAFKGDMT